MTFLSYMLILELYMRDWCGVEGNVVTISIEIVWIHGFIHSRTDLRGMVVDPLVQYVGQNGWKGSDISWNLL